MAFLNKEYDVVYVWQDENLENVKSRRSLLVVVCKVLVVKGFSFFVELIFVFQEENHKSYITLQKQVC
jgi:hypothetical protein